MHTRTKRGNCEKHCLYNIVNDPGEHTDLSMTKSMDNMLHEMILWYDKYGNEPRNMQDQGHHSVSDLPILMKMPVTLWLTMEASGSHSNLDIVN